MTVSRYMRTGLALLATVSLLAACGGGGGGGPTVNVTPSTPVTPGGTGGTPDTPVIPEEEEERPETPVTAGGGGGNGSDGTEPPDEDEEEEDEEDTGGRTPDGIKWNGDRANDQPDENGAFYVFQTDYTLKDIEDAAEDDPATPDVDETMRRADYIRENILLDAKYARLTAQTIPNDIFEIRSGIEVGKDGVRKERYNDEDEDTLPLIAFGTERDTDNTHPLVAKQGVSMGIDMEAKADITEIRKQIRKLDQYRDRAEAAKKALEDEIDRLTREANKLDDSTDSDGDGIGDGQAQMKRAEADQLGSEILTLETRIAELDTEIQPLKDEVDQFIADPAYVPTSNDPMFPILCDSLSDCRAKKAGKELDKAALERDRDDKTGMVSDLRDEERDAFDDAADYRGQIPGLRGHVATVEGDIDDINLLKVPVVTTLEAEEEAARPSRLARLIQDRLTAIAANGDFTGRFLGPEAAENLDAAGDAVFARLPEGDRGGVTPEAALRAIAKTHTARVEELRLEASSGDPQDLQDLDANLGRHWRMNLDAHAPSEATPVTDWTNTDRGDSTKGTFRGITGTFYCTSATCADPATASTFGAGWFFTPSVPATTENPNARDNPLLASTQPTRFRYEDSDGDGVYEPLWYADYGMWLTWDATQATDLARLGIQTRAGLVGPDGGAGRALDLRTPNTPSNNLDATATYSGTARGLSARTTGAGDDATTDSGHFTADVTLNARFGVPFADPEGVETHQGRLGGTIGNFRGGAHVNSAWRLTLEEGGLTGDGEIRAPGGVFSDDGVTGRWRAKGYVASGTVPANGVRPTGFFGDFAADFGDGAAIGVYSAD